MLSLLKKEYFEEDQRTNGIILRKINNHAIQKFTLPGCRKKKLCSIKDFVYCKADSNYTMIYMANGTHLLLSKTMSEVINIFPSYYLVRPHHSYVLNILHVESVDNGQILLKNKTVLPISRRKKKEVIEKLSRY